MKATTLALLAALLAGASPAAADILVLKNGEKVEWVTLRDKGNVYEVETPQKKILSIRKTDVERFVRSAEQAAELTGAVFVKAKSKPVNLLGLVNPKRDSVSGDWKFTAGKLSCDPATAVGTCRLEIPYTPGEEYDIEAVIEARGDKGEIVIGLVGGKKQFGIMFDGSHTNTSGVAMLDQNFPAQNETGVPGRVFGRKPRLVQIYVRNDWLRVEVDGKPFLAWKTEYSRAGLIPVYLPREKDRLFLATAGGEYVVSRLTVAEKD